MVEMGASLQQHPQKLHFFALLNAVCSVVTKRLAMLKLLKGANVQKIEFIPLTQETRDLLKKKEAAVHLRMKTACLQIKANPYHKQPMPV